MSKDDMSIYERLLNGESIPTGDAGLATLAADAEHTFAILQKINTSTTVSGVRDALSELLSEPVDSTTTVYTPFSINSGKNLKLGKHIFINQNCQILDLGGVEIKDHVKIGPRVSILSETHPVDPATRKTLIGKPVVIEENVWLGSGCTILPGVTVGVNSVVAAGAVVNKDVPANVVVAGVPAKVIRENIDQE